MPIYEYFCEKCGYFEELRPISDWDKNLKCKTCNIVAQRIISVPNLNTVSKSVRAAHYINEKSSSIPKTHSCCSGGSCSHKSSNTKKTTKSNNAKSFPNKRPWMISH